MSELTLLRDIEPIASLRRPRVCLIDLSAVFWWKWHAAAGQPIDTAFEFAVGKVVQLATDYDRTIVCCDSGRSFRFDLHPLYKANRPPKDEAAVAQMKRVQVELRGRGFTLVGVAGYEADDVIGTLVGAALARDLDVVIAGTDKDLLQLVGPRVRFHAITSGTEYGADEVKAKLGVGPELVRDYLALVGDSADNVKGVPKIGPKNAAKLLTHFGDAPRVVAALGTPGAVADVASPSIEASLAANLDVLEMARKLVSLALDVPLALDELLAPIAAIEVDDMPPVCPGCHAVGEERCAPGCIDEELRREFEDRDPDPPPEEEDDPAADPGAEQETTTMTTQTNSSTNGAPAQNPSAPAKPAPTPAKPTSRFGAAKVSTAPDKSAEKIILTGRSGIGKTWLVSTIPTVFLLAIEDGLKGCSPDHQPAYFADEHDRVILPRTLPELLQALDEFAGVRNALVNGKRPHRHLAIDGLTGIEALVHKHTLGVEKVPNMAAKEFQAVWHAAEPFMESVQRKLDAIRATGVNVWVLAHSSEVVDATIAGDVYRKWDLLLKGSGQVGVQARNLWRSWANHVFFIDWAAKVVKGDKTKRAVGKYEGRVLYTRESGTHYAKTRARLPASIPATWEDLQKAMAAGAAATEPKLRAQVEALLPRLSAEDRAVIEADLRAAEGANRVAAILSRAEGMVAVADEDAPGDEETQPEAEPTAAE